MKFRSEVSVIALAVWSGACGGEAESDMSSDSMMPEPTKDTPDPPTSEPSDEVPEGTRLTCSSPQRQETGSGEWTSLVSCDEGYLFRPGERTCPNSREDAQELRSNGAGDECVHHLDCPDPYGFCTPTREGSFRGANVCAAGCITDADCSAGQACLCGPDVGHCVPADCTATEDCGAGELCLMTSQSACGNAALICSSTEDECVADQDCDDGFVCAQQDDRRTCVLGCIPI